jgi:hypothetical protein
MKSAPIMEKKIMKKRIVTAFLFGIILALNAEASLISFLVIETGLPENAGNIRHSALWENAFMDVFFDSGYVVTNYPMMRLASKPEGNIQEACGFDVSEAKEAGVDYLLIAKLEYVSAIYPPQIISFYVFRVDQHEIIYEKQVRGKTYGSDREASDDMKKTIKELVQFVVRL